MDKIIMKEPNYNGNFFEYLLSKNKEGIILFDDEYGSWRVALNRDFIRTLWYMFDNRINYSLEEWHDFFNVYILNWRNNVNRNWNITSDTEQNVRNQFVEYFFYITDNISFHSELYYSLQNNLDSPGFYIEFHPPLIRAVISPWDNQITIHDC